MVGSQRPLTHITSPRAPLVDALNAALYPGFLRRRFVPPLHQVATEEVDRELLLQKDTDSKDVSLVAALIKKNNEEKEEKEDIWSRLNELATFALVGFGFFTVQIGAGTYNRERKNTTLRQSTTDRDALWDMGIRVPLGHRFSHDGAALTCGTLHATNVAEDVILLSDCYPKSQEVYDTFAHNGKNMRLGSNNLRLSIVFLGVQNST